MNFDFYKGKTVLITGHTGFKGSWLSLILSNLGANVVGYSLAPKKDNNLFSILQLDKKVTSIISDIRDKNFVNSIFDKYQPQIVFHLAAQPLVRDSYLAPHYTYDVNINGTLNVLDSVYKTRSVKSFVNVTTDKVYKNNETDRFFKEGDPLDGYDPYSNSKSCSDLITNCYKRCFLNDSNVAVSIVRAGNVIGGGDFSKDRIIPDCINAAIENKSIVIRNPNSIRPYQYVLEPLFAYLLIAREQYENKKISGTYNIGPNPKDCVTTKELVDMFCKEWGNGSNWISKNDSNAPHEANFLKLDCEKIKTTFNWNPIFSISDAIKKVCDWYKAYFSNKNILNLTLDQINEYQDKIN